MIETELSMTVRALTVLFAFGIAYIAFEAWRRRKKKLLLLVSTAFLTYFLRDIIHLAEIVIPQTIPPLLISMADILDLVTLLLIFFAVIKE